MGTQCHVVVEGAPERLLDVAQRRVEELEHLWTRFSPDSELSRLNKRGRGQVTADSFRLIATSLVGWRLSSGTFDPFLVNEIIATGYDRDFAELQSPPLGAKPEDQPPTVIAAAREFQPTRTPVLSLDRRTRMVQLGAGVGVDSGGIGKGLAADIVSLELIKAGAHACLVNLGGDLRVRGVRAKPWVITVADETGHRQEPISIKLHGGALATSSVTRRRWATDAGVAHHLLDPRTGRTAASAHAAASAIAPSGWLAEVLSKCVMLLPQQKAARLVTRHNAAAVLQGWSGEVTQLQPRLGFPPAHRP